MAATKGNEFWRKRSKHGRDKIFATPELLWDAAVEYFEYTDTRVWNKIDFKGKNVEEVLIPTSAPYTITGLCIFLDVNLAYFRQFKSDNKDFSTIISKIEEIIYTQKFEGATVGTYNSNIIARDLGLSDKTDITTGGEKISSKLNDLSFDELMTLAHGTKGSNNT